MSLPLQSCPSRAANLDGNIYARLRSVSRMVKDAASAAKQRIVPITPDQIHSSIAKSLNSQTKPSDRLLRANAQLHKGVQCLEEFHEFIGRRYGNTMRVWFLLDIEENMKIGEKVFIRRVLDLGFRGNVSAMYKYVDSDRSGSISIIELDSNAAIILAGFKKFMDEHFKCDSDACFHAMDRNNVGRLSRVDVVHTLERLHYDGDRGQHDYLFDLLDRQGFGYVVPRDLGYLKKWKPRAYLFAKEDPQKLRQLKEGFCLIHGSEWRTWKLALDTEGNMRVSWEEFFMACKKLQRQLRAKSISHPLPVKEDDVAGAWRALDHDCSGW